MASSHILPFGRFRPALEIFERLFVWRDDAGARARLDRHVADGHAAFHRQRADRLAGKFQRMADAAGGADLADDGEDHVLGGDVGRQLAIDDTRMLFGLRWISVWVASTCSTSVVPMP